MKSQSLEIGGGKASSAPPGNFGLGDLLGWFGRGRRSMRCSFSGGRAARRRVERCESAVGVLLEALETAASRLERFGGDEDGALSRDQLERRGGHRLEVVGLGDGRWESDRVRVRELGHGVDHVAAVVLEGGDGIGVGLGDEGAMSLDELAVGKGDSSTFGLTTLAPDLAFALFVIAFDLVGRELVEEGRVVVGFGAEGLEKGGEELASKVFVLDGNALDVAEDAERFGVDVDLLANRVGDGGAEKGNDVSFAKLSGASLRLRAHRNSPERPSSAANVSANASGELRESEMSHSNLSTSCRLSRVMSSCNREALVLSTPFPR